MTSPSSERFYESEEGIKSAVELIDNTLTAWQEMPDDAEDAAVTVSLRDLVTLATMALPILQFMSDELYTAVLAKHQLAREAEKG